MRSLAVAHKGFVGFEVETEGARRTGRVPTSASTRSRRWGPCSRGSQRSTAACGRSRAIRCSGRARVHASLIEGGQEYSSYPAGCLLTGERRTIPGETLELVRAELNRIADGTGATVRVPFHRGPFETAIEMPVVAAFHRHLGHANVGGVAFALRAPRASRNPNRPFRTGHRRPSRWNGTRTVAPVPSAIRFSSARTSSSVSPGIVRRSPFRRHPAG